MRQVPLHVRSASTAQIILGSSCAEVKVVRPSDVAADDEREFFVTAWCADPRFIPMEEVLFVPEPRVMARWLLPRCLRAFATWSGYGWWRTKTGPPPASPPGPGDDDTCHGGDGSQVGSEGPPRGSSKDDRSAHRDSEDDDSLDSNYNNFHPGFDCQRCNEASTFVLVGAVRCPVRGGTVTGKRPAARREMPDVPSGHRAEGSAASSTPATPHRHVNKPLSLRLQGPEIHSTTRSTAQVRSRSPNHSFAPSPSPMWCPEPQPEQGLVGHFLNKAPMLLQAGRSLQSPPVPVWEAGGTNVPRTNWHLGQALR